jgi:hypothetical protein
MKLINTLTGEIFLVRRRGCDYRVEISDKPRSTMTMDERQFLAFTFKPEIQEIKEPETPAHYFLRLE